jgi:hypothetical protein
LIFIKDAIRVGNSTLDKDGYTNDHNIFLLSNLNRRRAFLSSLNTFEGKRTTLKSKGKEIEFKANLKWKDVDEELKKIEGEVREFENKLSDFNHSTTVSVNIYSDLGLL